MRAGIIYGTTDQKTAENLIKGLKQGQSIEEITWIDGQQNPPLKQRACRGNTQAWLISLSSRLATTLPLNRQVLWNATLVPDTTVSY